MVSRSHRHAHSCTYQRVSYSSLHLNTTHHTTSPLPHNAMMTTSQSIQWSLPIPAEPPSLIPYLCFKSRDDGLWSYNSNLSSSLASVEWKKGIMGLPCAEKVHSSWVDDFGAGGKGLSKTAFWVCVTKSQFITWVVFRDGCFESSFADFLFK